MIPVDLSHGFEGEVWRGFDSKVGFEDGVLCFVTFGCGVSFRDDDDWEREGVRKGKERKRERERKR